TANKSHPLCDTQIVFTGDLTRWTRQEATALAAKHGANCRPNVTKKTNYLVVSDTDYGQTNALTMTSKLRRALELVAAGTPIQIIPEADFATLL
ncbi:MAG: BRCT domain-containing protein, partial [Thermoleophilaceae bacterium]|nr:BRCT domain-containing protein [Thermoleophilaceae bacterium]